ncbi:MAG: hypothetical protein Q9213_003687, partial [Squamulea squamosa]
MQNLKGAANYVSEKVQGTGAQASKETNKSIAKDGNVPIGTRARAAGDMISDKLDQHGHEIQSRFASEEAQTRSEPEADGAQAQHGDNSIAASSQEQSEKPAQDIQGRSSTQGQEYSTIGDLASSAAGKVKETASNAYDTIAGGSGPGPQRGYDSGSASTSRPYDSPPSKSIYVGNLFFDVREDDLRKKFEECGTIENVKLIMDNRGLSKG